MQRKKETWKPPALFRMNTDARGLDRRRHDVRMLDLTDDTGHRGRREQVASFHLVELLLWISGSSTTTTRYRVCRASQVATLTAHVRCLARRWCFSTLYVVDRCRLQYTMEKNSDIRYLVCGIVESIILYVVGSQFDMQRLLQFSEDVEVILYIVLVIRDIV